MKACVKLLMIGFCLMAMTAFWLWATVIPAFPSSEKQSIDPPVIAINEIAWGGTKASPFDEWIELYNTTAYSVNLDGWHLYTEDGGLDFYLEGVVSGDSYYLIERTDDTTVSDITADLTIAFGSGLHNEGEVLFLTDAEGMVIDSANVDGGPWPNDGDTDYSMERINPRQQDNDSNWASNNGVLTGGHDANGFPLMGTPKMQNSVYITPIYGCDLRITKQGPAHGANTDLISYTITLTGTGTIPASSVLLTDSYPSALLFNQSLGPFIPQQGDKSLIWHIGTVTPNTVLSWTVSYVISTSDIITVTNYVTCSTTSDETDDDNNFASHRLQIGQDRLLISAILFDGYQLNDMDEAIEITNPSGDIYQLDGWELCKSTTSNLYCSQIHSLSMMPGQSVWIAQNSDAFLMSFGHPPDLILDPWLNLANDGGLIYLKDTQGNFIDAIRYGENKVPAVGWSGPNVQRYAIDNHSIVGQILTRIPDENSGLPIQDTDTILDWMQNTGDMDSGRRVWYPGWTKNPLFWSMTGQEQASVWIGIAPDNAFDLVSQTILRAQKTISMELYTFNNPHLLPLLTLKAQQGVNVKLLLEGNPVGLGELSTEWQTQLYICSEIERFGGECWFMRHNPLERIYNRYLYLHSKMIIIDDNWVMIGSQNFTNNSLPADEKSNGTAGTRGVVIATNAPTAIQRARETFAQDYDYAHHNDLVRWNTGSENRYHSYQPDLVNLTLTDYVTYTTQFTELEEINSVLDIEFFTAPEAALRQSDALIGLVKSAGHMDKVMVEQLYEYVNWGEPFTSTTNLRLQAYIDAARRGASVRILLNKRGFTPDTNTPPEENLVTLAYINSIAQSEDLNLQAILGDPTGSGIHNKMILVDLQTNGRYSHIGSLNGSEAASKVNREVVIQLKSDEIHEYLTRLFEYDWWVSTPILLPIIARNYTAPSPPVNYIVISEVFYSPDPAAEWIELYNPTNHDIFIDHWKLGDAESKTSYEPMFQFPLSTTIPAQGNLVIAVNAKEVFEADYEFYESNPAIQNMIPDPDWGTQAYPLSLRDAGDHVLFMDPYHNLIDSVVWGDALLSGIIPHPGKINVSASLERYPPFYDTESCLNDFIERYPPTPGKVIYP